MHPRSTYHFVAGEAVKIAPVTMPKIRLADLDDAAIAAEAAEAAAKIKTIRLGRDAWEAINKAESFEAWAYRIGPALAIGKAHALKVSGVNQAWGQHYSREFGAWIKSHGFERMAPSVRSAAIQLRAR